MALIFELKLIDSEKLINSLEIILNRLSEYILNDLFLPI